MSIKLKDTISDLINNSDKLDGKHASEFAASSHGIHWKGFVERTSGCTWGTLTESNGYTPIFWMDSSLVGGGVAFSDKGSQTSMQIDGFFYQNEGKYVVLDENNYTSYTVTKTGAGASGTWGINISGNASTATSATSATSATNATNATNSTYASLLAKQGGTSTAVSIWTPKSTYTKVWGQNFVDSNITTDTGDLVYYLRNSEYVKNGTELCVVIDGDFYAGSGLYKVLHEGNSSVSKSGETLTVKINGVTQSLTNTNTWRGITDSYSGTDSTISLSQKGAKALYDALAHSHPYLSTSGGTLSGTTGLTLTNSSIWIQGGSAAGGNSNRLTTTSGMPTDMQYNTSKRGTRIYSNGIAFCDPYNGNSNNDSGWIRHIETTANKSILEIAMGDDGESSEEIRFRKYNTSNNIVYDVLVPHATGTLALTSQIPTIPTIPTSLPANGGNSDTVDNYHATDLVREFWTNNPGYNGDTYNSSPIITFSYANKTPYTGVLVDLNTNGYGVMFNTNYYGDSQLAYRRHGTSNDGGMGEWRYLIDNKTIGSQSVSYATSSGSSTYASLLTKQGGTSTDIASWNPKSSWIKVWGQKFTDTSISSDTGDILYYLRSASYSSSGTELCVCIDGDYYAGTGQYKVIHEGNISNYVTSSTNADTVDGYHASSLWRSDGGSWNPGANISLTATANNQEWSFDITRNGKTGCYWHVWDSSLGSLLGVNADNGLVTAYYAFNCATLQIGGQTITFTT